MKEKLSLLTELIKLAQCDQEVREQEYTFLLTIDQETAESELEYMKNIGIRLGLNPIATSKVLEAMDDYPNKIVPPERMIEIFKENYN